MVTLVANPWGLAILAAVAIVLSIALAASWPRVSITLWIALLPVQLDTMEAIGYRFSPADVVLMGLLVRLVALRSLWKGSIWKGSINGPVRAAILLLIWLTGAAARGIVNAESIATHFVAIKLVGLASLILSLMMVSQLPRALGISTSQMHRCYLFTGSAWNFVGLIAIGAHKHVEILELMVFAPGMEDRLRGLLVDPNAYGGDLSSVALLQLVRLTRNESATWGGPLNLAALLLGIALADSRSAWLGFGCGALALAALDKRLMTRKVLATLAVLIGVAISSAMLLSPDTNSGYEAMMRNHAIQVRLGLAQVAASSFSSAPIAGVGLGRFSSLPGSGGAVAHSTYLWLLAETGLIGLILLLATIFSLGSVSRTSPPSDRTQILFGTVTLASWVGLMIGIEALYQRHYWFVSGALCEDYEQTPDYCHKKGA